MSEWVGCSRHSLVEEPAQWTCVICGHTIQKKDAPVKDLWSQWKVGKSFHVDSRSNPAGVLQPSPPFWFLEFELDLFGSGDRET